jgi:hypothetical protein
VSAVDAALDYARRFGPVWLQTSAKTGYRGTNGSKDATQDENALRRLWALHPDAVPAVMTGAGSNIIALDVDIKNGRHGVDALELLGVSIHPETPTAHTPNGGIHLLFRSPGHPLRSSQDRLGAGLEVKGDGAWITLPPGPDRRWDTHLGPDTPLAPMPEWMVVIAEPEPVLNHTPAPIRPQPLDRYAEAALDGAVKAITSASAGQQRDTLNREIYGIARLVAGNVIPAALAIEALTWAARQMRSLDTRHPWRPGEIDRMVRAAFADGLARPRQPAAAA